MAGKKRGLGRGLDALLGPTPEAAKVDSAKESDLKDVSHDEETLQLIPVEWIQPGRFQPRRQFDAEKLEELAASIRLHGIMQPILVRQIETQRFELIAGERRWRASQLAGLGQLPCLVKAVEPKNQLALGLIENIQRENLNPLEEALALSRLVEEFSLTHQEVGEAVGKSRTAVSNALRLSKLGGIAADMLLAGQLEMGHARALLTLEPEAQGQIARQIVAKQLNVRQTENLVKRRLSPTVETVVVRQDADVARLEHRLSEYFGQAVKLKKKGARKGQLIIDYNSFDELEGVLNRVGFAQQDGN
ncbi:MAG: ParB/RepB/Spo0J family partition protein [Gammaproteobacteria bacterium]|nr:ParB/RepB/Spo0J family partition protein [Gammaproteobacteria bacterium]